MRGTKRQLGAAQQQQCEMGAERTGFFETFWAGARQGPKKQTCHWPYGKGPPKMEVGARQGVGVDLVMP